MVTAMKDYVFNFEYTGGKAFHALLNGHIFMDAPGYVSGMQTFFCATFLVSGENTLRIVGGKMSAKGELEGKNLPEMDICLACITSFSDNAVIPLQTFSVSNDTVEKDDSERESCDITFSSPANYDCTKRFSSFVKLNADEEMINNELRKMKQFAYTLYTSLLDENFDYIAKKSHIKIDDMLEFSELTHHDMKIAYIRSLRKIKDQGMGCIIESEDQFVFCPSCDGKIWKIGVMNSSEQAKSIQDAIKMLPAALPPFEYELFQSRLMNNSGIKIPLYIALSDENYCIVR